MRQTANCIVLSMLPVHIQMTEWSQHIMGLIQQVYGIQKSKVLKPVLPPYSFVMHTNPYAPTAGA